MRLLQLSVIVALGLGLATSATAHEEKLEGSEWGVLGDQGDDARFISFAGGGRLFGFGGCNRISGTYEQLGPVLTLKLSPEAKQNRCSTASMHREEEFMAILAKVHGGHVDHTLLLLLDENGADLRTLSKRNFEPAGEQ